MQVIAWRHRSRPNPNALPSSQEDAYPLFKKAPLVRLDYGAFMGKDTASVRYYLGVPYAQAPIGSLRFRPPRPPRRIHGIMDVTKMGNGCFQDPVAPPLNGLGLNRSEDCLNLNIWAPPGHSASDGLLPVLVWILPGGFTSGYASNPLYG